MLSALVTAVVVSAAPLRLAAPNFTSANLPPDQVRVATDHFAQQLSVKGYDVVTENQIIALIGLERQKELLGCSNDSGCMAELSSALGAEGLITGTLGKFGEALVLNIKVVRTKDGQQLAVYTGRVDGPADLPDELNRAAASVHRQLRPTVSVTPVAGLDARPSQGQVNLRRWAVVPAGVGVAALVASGVFFAQADGARRSLASDATSTNLSARDAFLMASAGQAQERNGSIAVAVGAAGLAAGATLFLVGGADLGTSVFFAPGHLGIGFAGELP